MLGISRVASSKGSNADFFSGGRSQKWWVVAIAMIGSCMSGVTFVSVPGMAGVSGFGYLQMCLGFVAGYAVIAFVLTPLYYRLGAVSIYQYLEQRFGLASYRTGAWFFFISKMLGASVRLFLVCLVLQMLLFDPLGLPFWVNAVINVAIVLLFTWRGGVKSVIWTDVLKTVVMVSAVVLAIVFIARSLEIHSISRLIRDSDLSRVFFFDDVNHPQFFWKQFLGGFLVVIATTGMDQDLMQRSLACKNFRDAQKNLMVSSLLQVVVIFLFLCLGVLLYTFAASEGITETGDKLFPAVATGGGLPAVVGILFVLGLVSCAYGAGGSALTALTTSFTVDILSVKGRSEDQVRRLRRTVHPVMAVLMAATIVIFSLLNNTSAIDAVYRLASYTYGPILGMFLFGILTKRSFNRAPGGDRLVPLVAVAAPLLCLVLDLNSERWFAGYHFSYELLLLNSALTFAGLLAVSRPGRLHND